MAPLDILYIGALRAGQTSLQRMEVMRGLGHQVDGIDQYPPESMTRERYLSERVRRRLFGPRDVSNLNGRIAEQVARKKYDVVWVDKGLTIDAGTLHLVRERQPGCVLVGYSPDDMMSRGCTSRQFKAHLPLYDIFFTTKSYGVAELTQLGARRVEFVENAYDPATHAPVAVTDADRARLGGPVGFIGDYEMQRARSMTYLAENGVPVRIWGPNWHKLRNPHPLLKIEGESVLGRDYAMTICAFDINLGFLRKSARDLQTTRSVEIPACGAFMLAERTGEHLGLFAERKEAEFFASDGELLGKVRYYLEHPDERRRIAAAGRERCLTGGYSNTDRLRGMIETVRAMKRSR